MEPEEGTANTPTTQGQTEKQKSVHAKIRAWLRSCWKLVALFLVALAIYAFTSSYQAQKPGAEAKHQAWATATVLWQSERPLLSIAYPKELRLESPGESRPIYVWLWRETPTPGPSPTPTATPSLTPAPTGMLSPTQAAEATPLPTPTPRPWIVAFAPHDAGILFTDQKGAPVAPQVALTPGSESAAPAVLYVQRAPLAEEAELLDLSVSVYGPDRAPAGNASLPTLPVEMEGGYVAWRRHLGDLLCGPTTFLVTAAAALVAFVVQEWRRRSEREEQERQRRDEQGRADRLRREQNEWEERLRRLDQEWQERQRRLDQEWQERLRQQDRERQERDRQEAERRERKKREFLYRVRTLTRLRARPEEAIDRYWTLLEQAETDPELREADCAQSLDETFEDVVPMEDLVQQAGKWFGDLADDKVLGCCELIHRQDKSNAVAQGFLDVLDYVRRSRESREK